MNTTRSAPHASEESRAPSRAATARGSSLLSMGSDTRPGTATLLQRSRDGCSCGGTCPDCADDSAHDLQLSLEVGATEDHFEREAELVADQVTRASASTNVPFPLVTSLGQARSIRRKTPARRAEVRSDDHASDREPASSTGDSTGDSTVLQQVDSMRTGGQPLSASVRGFFEPRFGRALGHVRVDTSGAASSAARALNAKAFTVGNYIAFGASHFAPGTERGDRLLAHELTHTIQQVPTPSVQRTRLSGTDDVAEADGEMNSSRGMPAVAARIQRAPDDSTIEESAGEVSDHPSEITWSKGSPGITEVHVPGEQFVLSNFAIDESALKKEHETFLREVIYFGTITTDPMAEIVIVGHADSTGSKGFNDVLSLKRARAVEAAFKSLGQHNTRIQTTTGRGSRAPISSNAATLGRADNRRVEITIKPFVPKPSLSKQLAALGKGLKPFVVHVENFAACPFPDTVKTIVEDAFKQVPAIQFDWTGAGKSGDSFITFDETVQFSKALGLSGDIFVDSFRNNEVCRKPGDQTTCEKVFPNTADVMGHAIANTVSHEVGHSLSLDHVPSTSNLMWSPELHPLFLKTSKTFDEKIELQRTLQAVPESFNSSQLVHMLNRIREKQSKKGGTVEFE